MKKKKLIRSPWTISIGTAIFSFLLSLGRDYTKSRPIFTTIQQILQTLLKFIISVLNFNIKVWWLIIGIIIIVAIIYLVFKFKQEETKPNFYNYRNGKLKSWKWSWDWEFNSYENKWHISNLTPHCPKCDTPLIDRSSTYTLMYECPRCDFEASDCECEEPTKIEAIIIDNIERKRRNNNT